VRGLHPGCAQIRNNSTDCICPGSDGWLSFHPDPALLPEGMICDDSSNQPEGKTPLSTAGADARHLIFRQALRSRRAQGHLPPALRRKAGLDFRPSLDFNNSRNPFFFWEGTAGNGSLG
jgi:hypothetical protein